MQLFELRTVISQFETFVDFAKAFALGERDLVITNDFLYELFMKASQLPCHFAIQEHYDTGEPSEEMMNQILHDLQGTDFDRVIAVGGGTVIDTSKLFMLRGLTDVMDAFDKKILFVKGKQLIIIPATCGIGSEVTNVSIAEIESRQTRMSLADNAIVADSAVIIPELLRGLLSKFYACSAIDTLIYVVKSFLSPKCNPYTAIFSEIAWQIIIPVFQKIRNKGPDYRFDYMDEMTMASNSAGIAFGNAGVGAVHVLSYPLGGTYHVPHGEANYQFFAEVFKAYERKAPVGQMQLLKEKLVKLMGCIPATLFDEIGTLLSALIAKNPLHTYGMKEEEIEGFIDAVIATQQRPLANNYTPLTRDETRDIYEAFY